MQIWETCFTSITFIGGKFYSNNTKNMNYVNKNSKELVCFILTLGKYISVEYAVFFYGLKQ